MELPELEAAGLNASLYGPPADRVGSSLQAAKETAARRNIAAKRRFIRFSMFYVICRPSRRARNGRRAYSEKSSNHPSQYLPPNRNRRC